MSAPSGHELQDVNPLLNVQAQPSDETPQPGWIVVWQRYHLSRLLGISVLMVTAATIAIYTAGNSLIPWQMSLVHVPIVSGIRVLFLMIPVIVWMMVSIALLHCFKPQHLLTAWLLSGWPTLAFTGHALGLVLFLTLPQYAAHRFEGATGKRWPDGAQLVSERHTLSMSDDKHFWFFESPPEVLKSFVQEGAWSPLEMEDLPLDQHTTRFPWASLPGSPTQQEESDWQPAHVWTWVAPKEQMHAPIGPAYVIADAEQRRWCVWWDGI